MAKADFPVQHEPDQALSRFIDLLSIAVFPMCFRRLYSN